MMAKSRPINFDNPHTRAFAIDWLLHINGSTCAQCGNPLSNDVYDSMQVRIRRILPGDNRFGNLELVHVRCETATEGAQAPESTQLGLDL